MKSSNTLKRVKFRIPSPDPPPSATVTPLDWLATRPRAIRPSPRTTHRDPVPYRQANFEACTLSASPNYSAILQNDSLDIWMIYHGEPD
ncbi:hypothetical protein QR680_009120 [Steinernema hermaphroditum]|uniref:Uncharacterized protein n=1 Tax=Steinernema hermaphroditum TaxID=289476 RepID=A0AA39ILG5_9BILA|nr:hypothetical protein QR680_009120 [Steinernema hermaphroditum]